MKNITIYYIIIIFAICLQIYYFLTNDSEILKEHIDYIISPKGSKYIKLLSTILLFLCILIVFYISSFLQKITRLNKYLIFAFIVITIANCVDFKLKTNVKFSNYEKDLDTALKKSNTGDFVLFRSYHSYDIPELCFFRYFSSLYSDVFFGHIGMIFKKNNEAYIIENTEDEYFCLHHKYVKNGPIIHNANDRIKEYSGRVHLSTNNLHNFVNEDIIYENFKKYEHYHFLQNGLACVTLISNILSDAGIMHRPAFTYTPSDFVNPKNYKVDYKQTQNIKVQNDFTNNK